MTVTMLIMGAIYCIVFIIGFIGNLWVIIILSKIIYKNKKSMSQMFRNIASYILTLSIVDLMVLSMIPLLLGQMFCDSWPFGYFGCKLFWAVENINKILSIGILTIMSFERLMAVYRPFNKSVCLKSNFFVIISILTIFSILLNIPIIYYADILEHEMINDNSTIIKIKICRSELPDNIMPYFITYMFTFCYILPAICITYCYIFLIKFIKRRPNNGSISMTASYIKKVTRSILKVSFFHLCCWGPFWIMLLIPVLNKINLIPDINYNYLIICKCITSFLPYINSMGNWYFYAVMNREIRNSTYGIIKRKDIVKIKELGSTVMHKISLRSINNVYN
ncbi:G protein-coupled receptor, rhodopsin-like family and GPCR, rhodopsin-like, 7TM domain-containing protein [Strongyloides ratti]|uniref:G protein-coupled receptor, rhodopsin-like family and GPCR, rhodopsin-like, 7TM domain-containing protein n=1 Tax=Strongyloides ratti TaxID=34506 RepID=A0A090L0G0_STRRB|nr:G protein-coupled receptor, rhodopsin-like family and GPCR, rhodopsin-like, 7TM domain-containing protein [Strongyloides ratti]CEF60984.1 G protein-coupled receptor, rhodopsin-like family and GPCR, rhodopsin-like, 7TM domain-containing protein [Strongyloides ratti]